MVDNHNGSLKKDEGQRERVGWWFIDKQVSANSEIDGPLKYSDRFEKFLKNSIASDD
jgi:hypothetical protein